MAAARFLSPSGEVITLALGDEQAIRSLAVCLRTSPATAVELLLAALASMDLRARLYLAHLPESTEA